MTHSVTRYSFSHITGKDPCDRMKDNKSCTYFILKLCSAPGRIEIVGIQNNQNAKTCLYLLLKFMYTKIFFISSIFIYMFTSYHKADSEWLFI